MKLVTQPFVAGKRITGKPGWKGRRRSWKYIVALQDYFVTMGTRYADGLSWFVITQWTLEFRVKG
jgi:hypothetical protein